MTIPVVESHDRQVTVGDARPGRRDIRRKSRDDQVTNRLLHPIVTGRLRTRARTSRSGLVRWSARRVSAGSALHLRAADVRQTPVATLLLQREGHPQFDRLALGVDLDGELALRRLAVLLRLLGD